MPTKKAPKLGVPVHAGAFVVTDESPDDYVGDRYIQPAAVDPQEAAPAERSGMLRRVLGDGAVTALKGAIGVPEAAVGLADIATGGRVGQFLENKDGAFGFRPKEAKAALDEWYSPEQTAAFKAVQGAANPNDSLTQRVIDTGAAALRNPSVIAHAVGESVPSIGAGGVIGRGVMAAATRLVPGIGVALEAPLVASAGARSGASAAQMAASGIGEGVVSAGSTAEQIRQESADGRLTMGQAGIAAGSGALTMGLGVVAAKAARSMGVGDIDTMLVGGAHVPQTTQKGFVRKLLEGALTEGVMEELPQSVQEQVAQNYALGKSLDDGVDMAAVMGVLSGGAMGMGAQLIHRPTVPDVGPMSRAANVAAATAPTAPAAPGAPVAPAAPTAPAAIPVERAEELKAHAAQRLQELTAATKGEKGAEGAADVAPRVLAPEEQRELSFLQAAAGDAQALARAYAPTSAPAPAQPIDEQSVLARMEREQQLFEREQSSRNRVLASFGADGPLPTATAAPQAPAAAPAPAAADADLVEPDLPLPDQDDILSPAGKPFKERFAAKRRQANLPDADQYVLAQVQGGYAIRRKPAAAAAAPAAEAPLAAAAAPLAAPESGNVATAPSFAGDKIDDEWTSFHASTGTLGKPRADMPQIKAEHRGAMVNFLGARGITADQTAEVDPATLKPTQAEFSPGKVQKAIDFGNEERSILVSADGHVLDGHHQWAGKLQQGKPVKVIKLNAPIAQLLDEVKAFPSATVDDGAAAAAPAQVAASQQVSTSPVETIDRESLMAAHKLPDGGFDANGAGDAVRASVSKALADGKDVSLFVEGKPRRILSVAPTGLKDTNGNPWGIGQIIMPARGDHNRLVIGGQPAAVPAPKPVTVAKAGEGATALSPADNGTPAAKSESAPIEETNSAAEAEATPAETTTPAGADAAADAPATVPGAASPELEAAGVAKPEGLAARRKRLMAEKQAAREAQPPKPAKPKKTKLAAKIADNRAAAVADYFAPGNVLKAYGGFDEVLAYKPSDDGGFSVNVHRVEKVDDQWVRVGKPQDSRWHATTPDSRELAAGPVERLAHAASAAVPYTEPRADGKPFPNAVDRGVAPAAAEQAAPALDVPAGNDAGKVDKPTEKIEDFGEKLEGARKDFAARMADAQAVDVAAVPLSESWPEPNYQKLLQDGADPFVVGWVRASRDEIPTKPQKPWKLKSWVESVQLLREKSMQLLDGSISKEQLQAQLQKTEYARLRDAVGARAALYEAVGHEHSLRGIRLTSGSYSMFAGVKYEPAKTFWSVEQPSKASAFGNWPRQLVTAETRDGAIAAFKGKLGTLDLSKKKPGGYAIWRKDGKFIVGKKLGKDYAALKTLDTLPEARTYLSDSTAELDAALERYKVTPFERREENAPRVGADHRGGARMTPEVFNDTFGFRGVQFGNYVEDSRRQRDLNDAYDALMDLSAVLGVPPKALSLNGELGLAFGARGRGGKNAAAAHYESSGTVINLTKNAGAGSLAHEWFHATDNYFAKSEDGPGGYMTEAANNPAVRPEMAQAFKAVMEAIRSTELRRRSRTLDERRSKPYWATDVELAARTFEAYVIAKLQDQGASNDYLANIVDEKFWAASEALSGREAPTYPYPTEAELAPIREAFDGFFDTVETRAGDDGKVALFSRDLAAAIAGLPAGGKGQTVERVSAFVKVVAGRWANAPTVVVAESIADERIPQAVRDEAGTLQSQGTAGASEGFFNPADGKVYLLADRLGGDADTLRVLMHESLGHYGLRGVFGPELGTILDRFATLNSAKVDDMAQQLGFDVTNAAERRMAAEEVLAYSAQTTPQLGWVKQAVAAVRTWLRDHVPGFGKMKLTDAEIVANFILPARRFVEGKRSATAAVGEPVLAANAMHSRPLSAVLSDVRSIDQAKIRSVLADALGNAGEKVSWWERTLGTQYAKAQKHPAFGKVFNRVQTYIEDVSHLANEAADAAPSVLPKLDNWRDLKNFGISDADSKAIAAPVFEGTLDFVRYDGKLMRLDDALAQASALTPEEKGRVLMRDGHFTEGQLKAWRANPLDIHDAAVNNRFEAEYLAPGAVFSDTELVDLFKLNPQQIGQYREVLAAVNTSLDQVVAADVLRLMDEAPETLKTAAMADRAAFREAVEEHMQQADPEVWNQVQDKFDKVERLKARGYVPLMRFGKFKVHIAGRDGETLFFGLYESRGEANRMARDLKADPAFADANVEQGVLSQEAHKLFASVPVESLEMFAEALGVEKSAVFQDYLKLTKNNRSALKRLIKRKGTEGFNTDVPRVLASFVTSNARLASGAMNLPAASKAAEEIEAGDLKDEAIKLLEAVQKPVEAGAAVRGMMFMHFIGGSIASAVVNITQPLTMTAPYLSQWGGAPKAFARLLDAGAIVAKSKPPGREVGDALRRAELEGIVSPQEIHHLQGMAQAAWGTNPFMRRVAFVWAAPFGLAEQFNRRVSFIAAYQTALQEKLADPFEFARKAVIETQGLYNRGNAPNLARGTAGALALQFKQFSIHYLEWAQRMWNAGEPGSAERAAGRKAVLLAIAILLVFGGADGLPFAEDIDDLADTMTQAFGLDLPLKRERRALVAKHLGFSDMAAEVFSRGISGLSGMPMDLSVRMGMGNLIPATGLFLRSNNDRSSDLLELAGPVGGLGKQYMDAGKKLLGGQATDAAVEMLPKAAQNAAKGIQMMMTGESRDAKGRKVMDATATDAVMKIMGFNPAGNARDSQAMALANRSEQLVKNVKGEISERWAKALADKDKAGVEDARTEMKDWNRANPDQPIRIELHNILQRVRKMRETRAERFIKTIGKERRAGVSLPSMEEQAE